MRISVRNHLSPVVAILTLTIGIATVSTVDMLMSPLQWYVADRHVPATMPETMNWQSEPQTSEFSELSCFDLNILPIWGELKRDATFGSKLNAVPGRADCSDLLRVTRVDLDGDKTKEFVVWGKDTQRFCGATANCAVWIFGTADNKVSKLLGSAGINLQVKKSSKNSFRKLVIRFNGGNYPDSLLEYTFDGRGYRLARCYDQDKQTLEVWEENCDVWEDGLQR